MRTLLFTFRLFGGKPLNTMTVEEARASMRKAFPKSKRPTPVAGVVERSFRGPASDLRVRIYTPEGDGPFPLLVYFHGGGFVVMDLDTHDEVCRKLCRDARCVVVSVDYRLAPEHKFPAATDDCLAAVQWAAEHAPELNADPDRIAVAGDSAGGNLATVTAMRIRDEGGPRLCGKLLVYPGTSSPDPPTSSTMAYGKGFLLTHDEVRWFYNHYITSEKDLTNPYLAPLRAENVSGLPPALVITAEFDPLRDEGEQYAERMQHAGVPVVLRRIEGMTHAFFMMNIPFPETTQAYTEACSWLQERFAPGPNVSPPVRVPPAGNQSSRT